MKVAGHFLLFNVPIMQQRAKDRSEFSSVSLWKSLSEAE